MSGMSTGCHPKAGTAGVVHVFPSTPSVLARLSSIPPTPPTAAAGLAVPPVPAARRPPEVEDDGVPWVGAPRFLKRGSLSCTISPFNILTIFCLSCSFFWFLLKFSLVPSSTHKLFVAERMRACMTLGRSSNIVLRGRLSMVHGLRLLSAPPRFPHQRGATPALSPDGAPSGRARIIPPGSAPADLGNIVSTDEALFSRLITQIFHSGAPDPELLQAAVAACHTRAQFEAAMTAFDEARISRQGFSLAIFEAQLLFILTGRFGSLADALRIFAPLLRSRGDVIGSAVQACTGALLRQCRSVADVAAVMEIATTQRLRPDAASGAATFDLLAPAHFSAALTSVVACGRDDLFAQLLQAASARHGAAGTCSQVSQWLSKRVVSPAVTALIDYERTPPPWQRNFMSRILPLSSVSIVADVVRNGKHDVASPVRLVHAPLVRILGHAVVQQALHGLRLAAKPGQADIVATMSAGVDQLFAASRGPAARVRAGVRLLILSEAAALAAEGGFSAVTEAACNMVCTESHRAPLAEAATAVGDASDAASARRPPSRSSAALQTLLNDCAALAKLKAALAAELVNRGVARSAGAAAGRPLIVPALLRRLHPTPRAASDVVLATWTGTLRATSATEGLALLLACAVDVVSTLVATARVHSSTEGSGAGGDLRLAWSSAKSALEAAVLAASGLRAARGGWLCDAELNCLLSVGWCCARQHPRHEAEIIALISPALWGAITAISLPAELHAGEAIMPPAAAAAAAATGASPARPQSAPLLASSADLSKAASSNTGQQVVTVGVSEYYQPLASIAGDPSGAILDALVGSGRPNDSLVDRFQAVARFPPVYAEHTLHRPAGGSAAAAHPRDAHLYDAVEVFDPAVLDDSADVGLAFDARTRLRMFGGSAVGRQACEWPDPLLEAPNNTHALAGDRLVALANRVFAAELQRLSTASLPQPPPKHGADEPRTLWLPTLHAQATVLCAAVVRQLRGLGEAALPTADELAALVREVDACAAHCKEPPAVDPVVRSGLRFLLNVLLHSYTSPRPPSHPGSNAVPAAWLLKRMSNWAPAAPSPGAPLQRSKSIGITSCASFQFAIEAQLVRPSSASVAEATEMALLCGHFEALPLPQSLQLRVLSLCIARGMLSSASQAEAVAMELSRPAYQASEQPQAFRDYPSAVRHGTLPVSVRLLGVDSSTASSPPAALVRPASGEHGPLAWVLRSLALYLRLRNMTGAVRCVPADHRTAQLPPFSPEIAVCVTGVSAVAASEFSGLGSAVSTVLPSCEEPPAKSAPSEQMSRWVSFPLLSFVRHGPHPRTRRGTREMKGIGSVSSPPPKPDERAIVLSGSSLSSSITVPRDVVGHLVGQLCDANQTVAAAAIYLDSVYGGVLPDVACAVSLFRGLCRDGHWLEALLLYQQIRGALDVSDTSLLISCGARLLGDLHIIAERIVVRVQQALVYATGVVPTDVDIPLLRVALRAREVDADAHMRLLQAPAILDPVVQRFQSAKLLIRGGTLFPVAVELLVKGSRVAIVADSDQTEQARAWEVSLAVGSHEAKEECDLASDSRPRAPPLVELSGFEALEPSNSTSSTTVDDWGATVGPSGKLHGAALLAALFENGWVIGASLVPPGPSRDNAGSTAEELVFSALAQPRSTGAPNSAPVSTPPVASDVARALSFRHAATGRMLLQHLAAALGSERPDGSSVQQTVAWALRLRAALVEVIQALVSDLALLAQEAQHALAAGVGGTRSSSAALPVSLGCALIDVARAAGTPADALDALLALCVDTAGGSGPLMTDALQCHNSGDKSAPAALCAEVVSLLAGRVTARHVHFSKWAAFEAAPASAALLHAHLAERAAAAVAVAPSSSTADATHETLRDVAARTCDVVMALRIALGNPSLERFPRVPASGGLMLADGPAGVPTPSVAQPLPPPRLTPGVGTLAGQPSHMAIIPARVYQYLQNVSHWTAGVAGRDAASERARHEVWLAAAEALLGCLSSTRTAASHKRDRLGSRADMAVLAAHSRLLRWYSSDDVLAHTFNHL